MAEAAVKFEIETQTPEQHVVSAVNLPQLADKANWLAERLRDIFPGMQDSHTIGWLRTLSGTNGTSNFRFVCTKNAIALSEYRSERMVVQPVILDHFVLVKEGADISEGQALYDDMKRWGMSIGATEIQINPKSDVPAKMIEERLGKSYERKITVFKVAK